MSRYEIAQRLGISLKTFRRWIERKPELKQKVDSYGTLLPRNVADEIFKEFVDLGDNL